MKIVKVVLSIITILFSILGLLKVISSDIVCPIIHISTGTLPLLRSVEDKNKISQNDFITALLFYILAIAMIYCAFII